MPLNRTRYLDLISDKGDSKPFKGRRLVSDGDDNDQLKVIDEHGNKIHIENQTGFESSWDSQETYRINDRVVYENSIYESLHDTNINHIPTDANWWKLLVGIGELAADVALVNAANNFRTVQTIYNDLNTGTPENPELGDSRIVLEGPGHFECQLYDNFRHRQGHGGGNFLPDWKTISGVDNDGMFYLDSSGDIVRVRTVEGDTRDMEDVIALYLPTSLDIRNHGYNNGPQWVNCSPTKLGDGGGYLLSGHMEIAYASINPPVYSLFDDGDSNNPDRVLNRYIVSTPSTLRDGWASRRALPQGETSFTLYMILQVTTPPPQGEVVELFNAENGTRVYIDEFGHLWLVGSHGANKEFTEFGNVIGGTSAMFIAIAGDEKGYTGYLSFYDPVWAYNMVTTENTNNGAALGNNYGFSGWHFGDSTNSVDVTYHSIAIADVRHSEEQITRNIQRLWQLTSTPTNTIAIDTSNFNVAGTGVDLQAVLEELEQRITDLEP